VKLLLDTCTFLWIAAGSSELSKRAAQLFRDPSNEVFLSAASVWEIAIKHSIGRLPLPVPAAEYITDLRERHGISSLPISEGEAMYLPQLPTLHRDPFDRMLACQAVVNGMAVLTPDPLLRRYPIHTIW
jgi:PIN domain nuclease of toxin-antitoxin system